MKKLIIGSDWWTDCDDAVAMRIFARAHNSGRVSVLGFIINACMDISVASLDSFLQKEGLGELPIGLDTAATDFGRNPAYQKRLAQSAQRKKSNADAEDPVRLYRRLLAESDTAVEIAEIGYLQTAAALLASPADDISDKTGLELVKQKVSRFWVMAGAWPSGRENNFARNKRSIDGGAYFVKNCPVPITFLGYEVGYSVISGANLAKDDHLKLAMTDNGFPDGRSSWDPMLALLATGDSVVGDDYDGVTGKAYVDAITGENSFVKGDGPHTYTVKKYPDGYYADKINAYIG